MNPTGPATLTLWAADAPPEPQTGVLCLWQESLPDGANDQWCSLPDLIDQDWQRLRADYLTWVHQLGQRKVRNRTVVERLMIRPVLSFWWMTVPSFHSLDLDASVYTAVRMMVLDEVTSRLGTTRVHLVGGDSQLRRVLKNWARAKGIEVICDDATQTPGARRGLHAALPVLGAGWVAALAATRVRRARNVWQTAPVKADVAVIDYLAPTNLEAIADGSFTSRYWGPLAGRLPQLFPSALWLHLGVDVRTEGDAGPVEAMAQLSNAKPGQRHELLRSRLTAGVLARSIGDYLALAWRLRGVERALAGQLDSARDQALWSSIEPVRRKFFWGAEAMSNCLWINVFEQRLARQPRLPVGLYLFENQPWEMAMINAWRAAGHGTLIGVSHSTMLNWDTRYFKGAETMGELFATTSLPFPDMVAVNGPLMRNAAELGHYPDELLVDVEALRYQAVDEGLPSSRHELRRNVLILGEYSRPQSQAVIDLLTSAQAEGDLGWDVRFRPHPGRLETAEIDGTAIEIDLHATLQEALDWADVALCGMSSSSAVDVVLAGRRPVIVRSGRGFPTNVLSGTDLADFVATSRQLAQVVTDALASPNPADVSEGDVMNLDGQLPRWQDLLSR